MSVFILLREVEQNDYWGEFGYADPTTTILGVYADRVKAEKELERLEEEDERLVEELGCDPTSYLIEERPVL